MNQYAKDCQNMNGSQIAQFEVALFANGFDRAGRDVHAAGRCVAECNYGAEISSAWLEYIASIREYAIPAPSQSELAEMNAAQSSGHEYGDEVTK